MIIDSVLSALHTIFSLQHFSFLILGLLVGLILGLLPGMNGIVGLTILFPFLSYLDHASALAVMSAMIAVVCISDSFSSILIGIPGTAASQATVVDGFELTKQGKPYEALGAAFSASLFGGIFGALVLSIFIFYAKPIILSFTSAELFMFSLLGLSFVGLLFNGGLIKGIASCFLGIVIGCIGTTPILGEERFTLGTFYLYEGLSVFIVALGIFALPEILSILENKSSPVSKTHSQKKFFIGVKETLKHKWLVLRCSMLGTLVGAIPGLGGSVVDWLAYGHVVNSSKDKSKFGKGDIRGVIAPESSNNAKEGGSFIPTILFGIPGSGTMALLLVALESIDIIPSLNFIETNLDLVYIIVWSLVIATIFGVIISFCFSKYFMRLLSIKYYFLAPLILGIVILSAYAVNQELYDLLALFIFGILGVLMKKDNWSRPALILGFVMSSYIELYFYQAMKIYSYEFLFRPIVIIVLFTMILSFWSFRKIKRSEDHKSFLLLPVCVFFLLFAICLYGLSYSSYIFPLFMISLFFIFLLFKKVFYARANT